MRIVHEGRGGYVELDDVRYPIELMEGGRFCVYFSGKQAPHLAALEQLALEQPDRWAVEHRKRR